jgi:hypothetical protein
MPVEAISAMHDAYLRLTEPAAAVRFRQRHYLDGQGTATISALPRRTVFTSAPVARAITATPPPPSA